MHSQSIDQNSNLWIKQLYDSLELGVHYQIIDENLTFMGQQTIHINYELIHIKWDSWFSVHIKWD